MILYFVEPTKRIVGGIRILHNHVDILHKNGFDAAMLYGFPGNITWFNHSCPIVYTYSPKDLIVIPEVYGTGMFPGRDRIIFNQNYYLSEPVDSTTRMLFSISNHNKNLLEKKYPEVPIEVVDWSLPCDIYYCGNETRENLICYTTHKTQNHGYIDYLKENLNEPSYKFVPLSGTDMDVANTLRRAKFFVQTGLREGCPRPPAEAMACGCTVVGFTGGGGQDYMTKEMCYPLDIMTKEELLKTLKEAIHNPNSRQMGIRSSEYILDKYSYKNEVDKLLNVWGKIKL